MALKPKLTFRKLEMIEAVARRGTVSAAADELAISQPALTQALKAIEADLDIILFTRGQRGLEPTAFVAPFLAHFTTIQSELQEVKRELAGKVSGQQRTLVVQCGPRSAKLWVEQAQALAGDDHPYKIHLMDSLDGICDRLMRLETDLAIMPAFGFEKTNKLIVRPFSFIRNQLFCRVGHPLLSIKAPDFKDIRDYPLAGDVVPPQYHPLFEGNFGHFAVRDDATGDVNATIFETSLERIFSKIKSSNALGLLPADLFAAHVQDNSLVTVNDSRCRFPELPVAIAYHKDNANHSDLQHFIARLRDVELDRMRFFNDVTEPPENTLLNPSM